MRFTIVFFIGVVFLSSCDLNKYTNVFIENKNNYPIEVRIATNNIVSDYRVEANASIEELRKWTDIELKDGAWVITIKNANTGNGKTYEHGHFYAGELTNSFTIRSNGGRTEFSADD